MIEVIIEMCVTNAASIAKQLVMNRCGLMIAVHASYQSISQSYYIMRRRMAMNIPRSGRSAMAAMTSRDANTADHDYWYDIYDISDMIVYEWYPINWL